MATSAHILSQSTGLTTIDFSYGDQFQIKAVLTRLTYEIANDTGFPDGNGLFGSFLQINSVTADQAGGLIVALPEPSTYAMVSATLLALFAGRRWTQTKFPQ